MKLQVRITINDSGQGFCDIRIPTSKDQEIVVQQMLSLSDVLTATSGLRNVLSTENKKILSRHMF